LSVPSLSVDVEGRVGPLVVRASFETGVEPLVLTGPNGSGKTSLLLMILGVLAPDRGKVTLDGASLLDTQAGVTLDVEARAIGYMPQSYGLFPHLTARENVEFALGCRRRELRRPERRERARALLAELGIEQLAEQRPSALSAGEQQRVALARAFAAEPKALLLDEPFAALDIGTRRQVRTFLRETIERQALPTVVVSHDAADARALGSRILVLEAGRVVQAGHWDELRENPASAFVRELTM
jgi:molybdate transport system ATP-binding protein